MQIIGDLAEKGGHGVMKETIQFGTLSDACDYIAILERELKFAQKSKRQLSKRVNDLERALKEAERRGNSAERECSRLTLINEKLTTQVVELRQANKTAWHKANEERYRRETAEEDAREITRQLKAEREARTAIEETLAKAQSMLNTNSKNSSKPPSSDQKGTANKKKDEEKVKAPNEQNTRKPTDRKKGGQENRKCLPLDVEKVRALIASGMCDHEIIHVGNESEHYKARFLIDTVTVLKVTEYRLYEDEEGQYPDLSHWKVPVIYGDNIRATVAELHTLGSFSNQKTYEFLRAQTNNLLPISEGTIYGMLKKMQTMSQPALQEMQKELLKSPVVWTDGTGVSVNGKQAYVRNFSTPSVELLVAMKSKSLDALKEIAFLSLFKGILVHDHETALYHFGGAHAECNVHVDRYLVGILELTGSPSAAAMRELLYEAKEEVDKRNGNPVTPEQDKMFSKRYDEILEQWREENKSTKYEFAAGKERTLINRLEKYKDEHLLFMRNTDVPFDNNASERALRRPKIHSKVTGGFRLHEGNEMCCDLMSIAATSRLRDLPTLEVFRQLAASEFRGAFLGTESPYPFGQSGDSSLSIAE